MLCRVVNQKSFSFPTFFFFFFLSLSQDMTSIDVFFYQQVLSPSLSEENKRIHPIDDELYNI